MFGRDHKLSKKIRTAILARDGNRCQKCRRDEHLDVHHIHGHISDESDNLATLCRMCHMEWHMVEVGCTLSFEDWLPLPSYEILLAAYLDGPPEAREAIDIAWDSYRLIHDPDFSLQVV